MAKNKKPKSDLCEVIRGIWDSLDSHLDLTHYEQYNKKAVQADGGRVFNKKCVVEYAEMILKLSKLL